MAEAGGGPQHSKIRILGHDGDPDLEETSRCFPLQKIGYISQDPDETSVWIHSPEGAREGEKGGKGSMKGVCCCCRRWGFKDEYEFARRELRDK